MPKLTVHRIRFFDYTPQTINCLCYDERSNRLALSRADQTIEIWAVDDNWFQEKIIHTGASSIEGLTWGQGRLFSAGLDSDVTEYDLLHLQPKQSTPSYSGAVWCLECNKQQSLLAAGTEEGCIALFDIGYGVLKYTRSFDKQDGRIMCLSWHPDGDWLVSGGADNIRIWSCNSFRARQRLTLQRHERQKEVIVWCVAVTGDFTIISGDSCARTTFWDGNHGTLIKSFNHKADVLTLCVNKEGNRVYSTGVHPVIVQYDFLPTSINTDNYKWIRTLCKSRNTHDVRALTMTSSQLVFGGVDCGLYYTETKSDKELGVKRIYPVPQHQVVHVSRSGFVMFQYLTCLEVWKLGTSNAKSDVPGPLPLSSKPVKVVELKAKDDETIVCSTISQDGRWLAYSNTDSVRLFKLETDFEDLFQPNVSLSRVRHRPAGLLASHRLHFTVDGQRLVSATTNAEIQVMNVDELQPSLLHTFPALRENPEPIHLLSISQTGHILATANHSRDISLYSLEEMKYLGNLPRVEYQATAMNVSDDGCKLLVAYTNKKIYEYQTESKQFTSWCRQTIDAWPNDWLLRPASSSRQTITRVQYVPDDVTQILVMDASSITIIDKTMPFPSAMEAIFVRKKKKGQDHDVMLDLPKAFRVYSKYKLLLYADLQPDDTLVVVERPESAIAQLLPESLQQKKFGT